MVSNHLSAEMGYLAGRYPGKIGHLYSPTDPVTRQIRPRAFFPYALDNGAFSCHIHGTPFDDEHFIKHCDRYSQYRYQPLWVAVPDVVCDAKATIANWKYWSGRIEDRYGWPLAFVVQDGMHVCDVPAKADLIFVGGSPEWKMTTLHYWCERVKRVHVGRINTWQGLWAAHNAGAESVDGTGWYHDRQYRQLAEYLEQCSQGGRRQGALW
jgi:hypothetical protein